MSELEPVDTIEAIVGALRHPTEHRGRAVSAKQQLFVLHSVECVRTESDLRVCEYSVALDGGIPLGIWKGWEDVPVVLAINTVWRNLVPLRLVDDEPPLVRCSAYTITPEGSLRCNATSPAYGPDVVEGWAFAKFAAYCPHHHHWGAWGRGA